MREVYRIIRRDRRVQIWTGEQPRWLYANSPMNSVTSVGTGPSMEHSMNAPASKHIAVSPVLWSDVSAPTIHLVRRGDETIPSR